MSVLAALSLPAVDVSASAGLLSTDHATGPSRNNAEIVQHPKICVHDLRRNLRLHLPDTIRRAFPAPSMHDMTRKAGRELGVSPDTVARLFMGNTDKMDVGVVCAIAARFRAVTGKTSPVAALIMTIVGGLE